ncbi:putative ATP-dependent RNA helicase DDX56 [Huso huso]|uniref:RNA helicase n=1 Tax=Huso huso TaxID=61971 RepID=A0ABR0YAL4_HUSHU
MDAGRLQFHEMGLDDRLLKALADLGWAQPTLIQEKAIPLALDGKDLLARARTGSGKTAAYAVPIIQHILSVKQSVTEQAVRALILVPSKELGQQVQKMIRELTAFCARDVRVVDISGQAELSAQRPILMEKPDIVVGTPSRVLAQLSAQNLLLRSSLEMLVIDEADLVFSFGFESDLKSLLCHLPKIYQAFLMSATFNEDVQSLKKLVLHNPVSWLMGICFSFRGSQLSLPGSSQLTVSQYHIRCEEEDNCLIEFLLIQTLVNQMTYNLNNKQIYILKPILNFMAKAFPADQPVCWRFFSQADVMESLSECIFGWIGHVFFLYSFFSGKDKEYSVSRGIDFQNVANVINFDFPTTIESYIHRVGRTARADNRGTALTFVLHTQLPLLAEIEDALTAENADCALKPYEFKMQEIEGFRYRCRDAMRSVTKQAVKEARLKEIKQELLNSEKLKTYFDDNPRDFQLLRHDKALHPAIIKPHLKNVPEYLIPPTLRGVAHPGEVGGEEAESATGHPQGREMIQQHKKRNPLKSFRYTGKQGQGKSGRGAKS